MMQGPLSVCWIGGPINTVKGMCQRRLAVG